MATVKSGVVVDRMSKMVLVMSVKGGLNAAELSNLYLYRVVYRGVSMDIVSDRDKLFTAEIWASLQHRLNRLSVGTKIPWSRWTEGASQHGAGQRLATLLFTARLGRLAAHCGVPCKKARIWRERRETVSRKKTYDEKEKCVWTVAWFDKYCTYTSWNRKKFHATSPRHFVAPTAHSTTSSQLQPIRQSAAFDGPIWNHHQRHIQRCWYLLFIGSRGRNGEHDCHTFFRKPESVTWVGNPFRTWWNNQMYHVSFRLTNRAKRSQREMFSSLQMTRGDLLTDSGLSINSILL